MTKYKFTRYFEDKVLLKRDYLKKEWCIQIIENYIFKKIQSDGERIRYWGKIQEFDNKIFRVITLSDGITIHNAFPDRRFKE